MQYIDHCTSCFTSARPAPTCPSNLYVYLLCNCSLHQEGVLISLKYELCVNNTNQHLFSCPSSSANRGQCLSHVNIVGGAVCHVVCFGPITVEVLSHMVLQMHYQFCQTLQYTLHNLGFNFLTFLYFFFVRLFKVFSCLGFLELLDAHSSKREG